MPIIGKQLQTGGYHVLDALSASATASYTMQLSSTNFTPESANHLIVSLNGVIQKPGSSYTVSGSTITFSSSLTSSDSIDFIIALGNVLDIGTPSDGVITNAKLAQDIISAETALTDIPADTDEILISDAGTLKRIDYSLVRAGTPSFRAYASGVTNVDHATSTQIALATEDWDTDNAFASSTFTVPSGKAGKYLITACVRADPSWAATNQFNPMIFRNGASNTGAYVSNNIMASKGNGACVSAVIDLAAADTIKLYLYHDEGGTEGIQTGQESTFMSGVRIG